MIHSKNNQKPFTLLDYYKNQDQQLSNKRFQFFLSQLVGQNKINEERSKNEVQNFYIMKKFEKNNQSSKEINQQENLIDIELKKYLQQYQFDKLMSEYFMMENFDLIKHLMIILKNNIKLLTYKHFAQTFDEYLRQMKFFEILTQNEVYFLSLIVSQFLNEQNNQLQTNLFDQIISYSENFKDQANKVLLQYKTYLESGEEFPINDLIQKISNVIQNDDTLNDFAMKYNYYISWQLKQSEKQDAEKLLQIIKKEQKKLEKEFKVHKRSFEGLEKYYNKLEIKNKQQKLKKIQQKYFEKLIQLKFLKNIPQVNRKLGMMLRTKKVNLHDFPDKDKNFSKLSFDNMVYSMLYDTTILEKYIFSCPSVYYERFVQLPNLSVPPAMVFYTRILMNLLSKTGFHVDNRYELHYVIGQFSDFLKFHGLIMSKESKIFAKAFTTILENNMDSNGNINLNYVLTKIYQNTSRGAQQFQQVFVYKKQKKPQSNMKKLNLSNYYSQMLDFEIYKKPFPIFLKNYLQQHYGLHGSFLKQMTFNLSKGKDKFFKSLLPKKKIQVFLSLNKSVKGQIKTKQQFLKSFSGVKDFKFNPDSIEVQVFNKDYKHGEGNHQNVQKTTDHDKINDFFIKFPFQPIAMKLFSHYFKNFYFYDFKNFKGFFNAYKQFLIEKIDLKTLEFTHDQLFNLYTYQQLNQQFLPKIVSKMLLNKTKFFQHFNFIKYQIDNYLNYKKISKGQFWNGLQKLYMKKLGVYGIHELIYDNFMKYYFQNHKTLKQKQNLPLTGKLYIKQIHTRGFKDFCQQISKLGNSQQKKSLKQLQQFQLGKFYTKNLTTETNQHYQKQQLSGLKSMKKLFTDYTKYLSKMFLDNVSHQKSSQYIFQTYVQHVKNIFKIDSFNSNNFQTKIFFKQRPLKQKLDFDKKDFMNQKIMKSIKKIKNSNVQKIFFSIIAQRNKVEYNKNIHQNNNIKKILNSNYGGIGNLSKIILYQIRLTNLLKHAKSQKQNQQQFLKLNKDDVEILQSKFLFNIIPKIEELNQMKILNVNFQKLLNITSDGPLKQQLSKIYLNQQPYKQAINFLKIYPFEVHNMNKLKYQKQLNPDQKLLLKKLMSKEISELMYIQHIDNTFNKYSKMQSNLGDNINSKIFLKQKPFSNYINYYIQLHGHGRKNKFNQMSENSSGISKFYFKQQPSQNSLQLLKSLNGYGKKSIFHIMSNNNINVGKILFKKRAFQQNLKYLLQVTGLWQKSQLKQKDLNNLTSVIFFHEKALESQRITGKDDSFNLFSELMNRVFKEAKKTKSFGLTRINPQIPQKLTSLVCCNCKNCNDDDSSLDFIFKAKNQINLNPSLKLHFFLKNKGKLQKLDDMENYFNDLLEKLKENEKNIITGMSSDKKIFNETQNQVFKDDIKKNTQLEQTDIFDDSKQNFNLNPFQKIINEMKLNLPNNFSDNSNQTFQNFDNQDIYDMPNILDSSLQSNSNSGGGGGGNSSNKQGPKKSKKNNSINKETAKEFSKLAKQQSHLSQLKQGDIKINLNSDDLDVYNIVQFNLNKIIQQNSNIENISNHFQALHKHHQFKCIKFFYYYICQKQVFMLLKYHFFNFTLKLQQALNEFNLFKNYFDCNYAFSITNFWFTILSCSYSKLNLLFQCYLWYYPCYNFWINGFISFVVLFQSSFYRSWLRQIKQIN